VAVVSSAKMKSISY